MKKIKTLGKVIFTFGLLFILIGVIFLKQDNIETLFNSYFSSDSSKVKVDDHNTYYRDYDFMYVKNIEEVKPTNFDDLKNIYYSVLNSGKSSFTFYCPHNEYTECLSDVQKIANDQELLSDINNYVHPYNAFKHIETEFDNLGKVEIKTVKNYNSSQIKKINKEIDKIYPDLVKEDKTTFENIKNVHDYIINNSKYDEERSDKGIVKYHSDIAYGPLFEGYAICGGYTDLMQLFLEKMGLKSFRVSSHEHIWNAVEIDGVWYNIDLTWDDPVADDGNDYLSHDYLLITTKELLSKQHDQHQFNQDIFKELKETN